MKKIVILLICLLLFVGVATAAGPKGTSSGPSGNISSAQSSQAPGLLIKEQQQTTESNAGVQQSLQQNIQQQVHLTTTNATVTQNALGLQKQIQTYQQELNQSLLQASAGQKNVLKNQNAIRLAVHTFLAAGNTTGGIGPQISQIAQEQAFLAALGNVARYMIDGDSLMLYDEVGKTLVVFHATE